MKQRFTAEEMGRSDWITLTNNTILTSWDNLAYMCLCSCSYWWRSWLRNQLNILTARNPPTARSLHTDSIVLLPAMINTFYSIICALCLLVYIRWEDGIV